MRKSRRPSKAGGTPAIRSPSPMCLGLPARPWPTVRAHLTARPRPSARLCARLSGTATADTTAELSTRAFRPFARGEREENSPTISRWKGKACQPAAAEIYMQMSTGPCARRLDQPCWAPGGVPGLTRRLKRHHRAFRRQVAGKPTGSAHARRLRQRHPKPAGARGLGNHAPWYPNLAFLPKRGESDGFRGGI